MTKEDYYGKWYLREGDLVPVEITENNTSDISVDSKGSVRWYQYLKENGLLFDNKEDADLASTNLTLIGRGIAAHTIMKEPTYDDYDDEYQERIYISGPISGHNFVECKERFTKVEEKLIAKGYRVFNPLKNGLPFDADTHKHMRRDLNILTNEDDPFDYIYMMRRWPHSSGCKQELDNAIACGIKVIFEDSECAVKFE